MRIRDAVTLAVPVLAMVLVVGCGPPKEQMMLFKALGARGDRQPTYVESARFLRKTYLRKHDKDYVQWSMDYGSICMMSGNYGAAKAELLRCFKDIEMRKDIDSEKAATVSNESLKIFKGEPFERAMVATYLGMLHYLEGDYNNARIFCTRADMSDATTADNMSDYRHDFRLAQYWLGRSFMKLGKPGNARVAFRKAGERIPRKREEKELKYLRKTQDRARKKRVKQEKKTFARASGGKVPIVGVADLSASPALSEMASVQVGAGAKEKPAVTLAASTLAQFLTTDFQKQVNLILVIEVGSGPVKFLAGQSGEMDQIIRAPYEERQVLVYLNGRTVGPAFQMLDMFHQADPRGTTEKDRLQAVKGGTKYILSQLPYVGMVASAWDVPADHRYWRLLPGEVDIFAAKLEPGIYTVGLDCFDVNGYL
ncbi:MAG: hypothetical protein QGD94_08550, partial [Planctomycetia bacterium]|nr:hypothetical protein [Planctomycetia bacterium]